MEIKNEVQIGAPAGHVYQVLTSRDYLLKTMPGLKSLDPTEDGRYQAVLELGVSAVRGRYTGTMAIVDADPPHHYRLTMEGKGPGAFVNLSMVVDIEELAAEEGVKPTSKVRYVGDAQVGGTIAGVGQRVMAGVANMVMGQFFQAVSREAEALA